MPLSSSSFFLTTSGIFSRATTTSTIKASAFLIALFNSSSSSSEDAAGKVSDGDKEVSVVFDVISGKVVSSVWIPVEPVVSLVVADADTVDSFAPEVVFPTSVTVDAIDGAVVAGSIG